MEISPALAEIQAKNVCTSYEKVAKTNTDGKNAINYYQNGTTKDGVNVFWYYSVNNIPQKFSVFIAHEFFDALPIQKFTVLYIINQYGYINHIFNFQYSDNKKF